MTQRIRIATYNVHKCHGMDRRVRPERIASVLRAVDADVIALQEVVRRRGDAADSDQAQYLADQLDYSMCFGENRRIAGAPYGNAILSRLPILSSQNYDLTWRRRERRGCLHADIQLGAATGRHNRVLHVFNVHLGTAFMERRHQGRKLVGNEVLQANRLVGPRVVVGDFNEWTRGLASRLMSEHLQSVELRLFRTWRRTYPGILPLLHLDHFYFDESLKLEHYSVFRTRTSLMASDHLPIVAEFSFLA